MNHPLAGRRSTSTSRSSRSSSRGPSEPLLEHVDQAEAPEARPSRRRAAPSGWPARAAAARSRAPRANARSRAERTSAVPTPRSRSDFATPTKDTQTRSGQWVSSSTKATTSRPRRATAWAWRPSSKARRVASGERNGKPAFGVEIVDRAEVLRARLLERDAGRQRAGGRELAVAAHEEVLAHGPEAVGGEQRVARAVARAEGGARELHAPALAELEGAAQQLAADALAALGALDDRRNQRRRRLAREAQEARHAEGLAVAGVGDEQVLLGLDPVELELGEQLLLRLPERMEHEIGLAPRAGSRRGARGRRRRRGGTGGSPSQTQYRSTGKAVR